jgi:hypothetical protein
VRERDWLDYLTLAVAFASLGIAALALGAGLWDRRRILLVSLNIGYKAPDVGLAPSQDPIAFISVANRSRRPAQLMGAGLQTKRQKFVQLYAWEHPPLLGDAESVLLSLDPAVVRRLFESDDSWIRSDVFDTAGKHHRGSRLGRESLRAWIAGADLATVDRPQ